MILHWFCIDLASILTDFCIFLYILVHCMKSKVLRGVLRWSYKNQYSWQENPFKRKHKISDVAKV